MNICFVYQDQYPWDVRVEKFCTTLANNGHRVFLVSRNRNGLPIKERVSSNIEIIRLYFSKISFLNEIINTPAFFSIFWLCKIYNVVKSEKCKLIIIRDLPLALSGIFVGKLLNIPVYMDMAENYPAMLADTWKHRNPKTIDYLIRNPKLLKIIELFALPRLDYIFVVSVPSKKRLIEMGVDENKISIIGNTPCVGVDLKIDQKIYEKTRSISDFIICYVGGLEESRGIETVVMAIPEIKRAYPNIAFVVVGKGSSLEYLQRLTIEKKLKKNVFFYGWKSRDEIPSIIKASDVCVIPHYVSEHIDTTIPNKIYDYMLQEKPIIVTNSKSLTGLVNECKCGLVFKSGDYEDFATKLLSLMNLKKRKQFGRNGFLAVIKRYNWKIDENVLLNSLSKK